MVNSVNQALAERAGSMPGSDANFGGVRESKTEIERVIAAAIDHNPQTDPEALAKEIISELHRAGRFIVPADPTDKMSAAVAKSRDQGHWGLISAWRAMVEAAQ